MPTPGWRAACPAQSKCRLSRRAPDSRQAFPPARAAARAGGRRTGLAEQAGQALAGAAPKTILP